MACNNHTVGLCPSDPGDPSEGDPGRNSARPIFAARRALRARTISVT
jgi:hypothetical protein